MVKKVIYNGDVSPCNVKVPAGLIKEWKTGEIKSLRDRCADKLVSDNKNFKFIDTEVSKKTIEKKVETVKKTIKYDLDGDGDFDKDDVSIGAKVMAAGRKLKKD